MTSERRAAYHKAWYAANRERILARARERYAQNPRRRAEYQREYEAQNAVRIKARRAAYYEKNSDQFLARKRRELGILNATGERRTGECPLCLRVRKLVCDHDHVTGAVRGWICSGCNKGLGLLGDNSAGIARAAKYLNGQQEAGGSIAAPPASAEASEAE